ncbi:MAG: SAV_2336 N-terminal domain-related protein, partial [Cyanobacteria bacterium P01_A01_bin.17]
MIKGLIAALGLELELTGEEIADVLWLTAHIQPTEQDDASMTADTEEAAQSTSTQFQPPKQPLPPEPDRIPEEDISSTSESHADVYTEGDAKGSTDLSFQVPDARSLREPLELARALKPLLRRVASGTAKVLDEEATVQRITDERVWAPVLKPTLEPWLDLVLIVDESPSMLIWQRTVLEFKRILERYGVFRNVSTWSLSAEENGSIRLRPGIGAIGQNQRPHSPSELLDPSGRRLILVASDCVSDFWQDGTLLPMLKLWAESGPMAIAQMLPQWLWERTALRFAANTEFLGLRSGMTNQTLVAKPLSRRSKVDFSTGIKIPVVTLQPEEFKTWASMLSGKGGTWAKGAVFSTVTDRSTRRGALGATSENLTAEERVQRFRITASPMGRKLAGLLASSPIINLPVVRIIQDRLLQQSKQVHVAEVFLGGLLEQVTEITPGIKPTGIQFSFLEGVRDVLLESVPKSEIINGFNEVSVFIAENIGLSLEEFAAVLREPGEVGDEALARQARPFARVTTQILRRLGGVYSLFAEQIESALTSDSQHNQALETNSTFTYVSGGIVQASDGIYLRRQADAELLKLCQNGDFVYVLAPRQTGKSSLIIHISEQLANQGIRT